MVYFITQGSRYIKIGYTKEHPRIRLSVFQGGNPYPLRLVMILPGGRGDEEFVHDLFRVYHVRGEWFFLSAEIEDQLDIWQEYCILSKHKPKGQGSWLRKGKRGVHEWD